MTDLPSMRFVHSHVRAKLHRLTRHATITRLERGIALGEMEHALLNGQIIESYPDAQPYPSALILGWLQSGDPLHVLCSRGAIEPALRIVTLYEPEDALWEPDFRTRKRPR